MKIIKNKALNAKIKEVFRENLPESAYYLGVSGEESDYLEENHE